MGVDTGRSQHHRSFHRCRALLPDRLRLNSILVFKISNYYQAKGPVAQGYRTHSIQFIMVHGSGFIIFTSPAASGVVSRRVSATDALLWRLRVSGFLAVTSTDGAWPEGRSIDG